MPQAEELLFSGPDAVAGFAKALFRGEFRAEVVFPYPELPPPRTRGRIDGGDRASAPFAETEIDAAGDRPRGRYPPARDRRARQARRAGDDGAGGVRRARGSRQSAYCRVMEVIGGHCSSTAVFVNAHHSIGIRALLLFGTPEQKARWLPPLARGEKLAAFALTETEAGSDASNVQTTATPEPTTAGPIASTAPSATSPTARIADVLTVMARTPDPKGGESKVTAFLVTPDMPGFEVVEARMAKCGIRGTATAKLAFHDMPVPAENILGPVGKGLKVALTVLDFGRTTFGASCTGMSKTLPRRRHPPRRPPPPVRPPAGRARADQEEARLPRRDAPTRWRRPPTRPPP